jgi:hypothetical protein
MDREQHPRQRSATEQVHAADAESGRRFPAEHQLRSELGPVVGPVSCATLGVVLILFGLFELFIALLMGPGNSDELVSGGPVLIPWFALPIVATGFAGVAVAYCRRLRFAHRALAVAAASVVAWLLLAAVMSA